MQQYNKGQFEQELQRLGHAVPRTGEDNRPSITAQVPLCLLFMCFFHAYIIYLGHEVSLFNQKSFKSIFKSKTASSLWQRWKAMEFTLNVFLLLQNDNW